MCDNVTINGRHKGKNAYLANVISSVCYPQSKSVPVDTQNFCRFTTVYVICLIYFFTLP